MTVKQFQALEKAYKMLDKAFGECFKYGEDHVVWSCATCPLWSDGGPCLKANLAKLLVPDLCL